MIWRPTPAFISSSCHVGWGVAGFWIGQRVLGKRWALVAFWVLVLAKELVFDIFVEGDSLGDGFYDICEYAAGVLVALTVEFWRPHGASAPGRNGTG